MADLKAFAEQLVNLTVKEVNELATILKDEYGIEPAAAAPVMVAGGGAAPLAARSRGTRRDQARLGVVVLRATVRAAIRLCRRAHAGSDPIVSRAHPVRRGIDSGGARER